MSIPKATLASDPSVEFQLREATVNDALDFADTSEGMEEAVTSLFLDRLQDKATWSDPKKWTGEDRRLALFWYWMHTTDDYKPALTFECAVCGEDHTVAIDLRKMADGYVQIEGKAERDIEFNEETIVVRPLTGASLEEMELMRLKLAEQVPGSGAARLLDAQIRVFGFARSIEFPGEKDQKKPLEIREKKLLAMGARDFNALTVKVTEALNEMKHGLASEYYQGRIYLLTEKISCEKEKEGGTRLRLPFRYNDYIPTV